MVGCYQSRTTHPFMSFAESAFTIFGYRLLKRRAVSVNLPRAQQRLGSLEQLRIDVQTPVKDEGTRSRRR